MTRSFCFQTLSFAKLNLYLKVRSLRKDFYHNIDTIFQEINLADHLFFVLKEDSLSQIEVYCPQVGGVMQENLVYKAIRLFLNTFKMNFSVKVTIDKAIPLGAGLGGGSSNASKTLCVLAKYKDIKKEKILPLAKSLGSDLPFFLYGGLAWAEGRGDEIRPMPLKYKKKFLIVVPPIPISTANVFKKLRILKKNKGIKLTKNLKYDKNVVCFFREIEEEGTIFFGNDLGSVVFSLYPEMDRLKKNLEKILKRTFQISGSGSSFFSEFPENHCEKKKVLEVVQQLGCRFFISAAVFRSS